MITQPFAPGSLCLNKTCCKLTLDILRALVHSRSGLLRARLKQFESCFCLPFTCCAISIDATQWLLVAMHRHSACCACLQATAQMYRIIAPNPSGVYYNVRIQVNQTEGHVGFYCNPSWGGQPQTGSTIAQSGNAVWQTGMLSVSQCSSLASAPGHVRTMIQMYRCACLAVVCKVQDACICLLQYLLSNACACLSPIIASKLQRLLPWQQSSCKAKPVRAIVADSLCLILSFIHYTYSVFSCRRCVV